jgi:hypothetical protein
VTSEVQLTIIKVANDKILIQKPDRKKPLGRHRHRWENNNTKMYLKEIG